MKKQIEQLSMTSLIINHFYMGVIITMFYAMASPFIIHYRFPGLSILLIAELIILAPLVFFHLIVAAQQRALTIKEIVQFREKVPLRSFMLWTLLGILSCILVYFPLYPVGIFLKQSLFGWLPEWYFNPSYGTEDIRLIANTFLIAIVVDGVIGPVAEEVFFRGYLLPRMSFLKNWAPVVNGTLFGLYHFWQPHNFMATIAVGIILSFIVWKTKNVYVAIAIHCSINILGAVGGFLAASGGIVISR